MVSPAGEVLSREGKYPKFPGPAGPDPWGAIKFVSTNRSAWVVNEPFSFSNRCRWVDFCRNRLILPTDRASVCSIAGWVKNGEPPHLRRGRSQSDPNLGRVWDPPLQTRPYRPAPKSVIASRFANRRGNPFPGGRRGPPLQWVGNRRSVAGSAVCRGRPPCRPERCISGRFDGRVWAPPLRRNR